MNIIFYNLIFLVSIFPIWTIKFSIHSFALVLITFFILFLFTLNNIIYKYLKNSKIFIFYLALVLTYGIDNNLGLFSDLLVPNVKKFYPINIYVVALVLLILIFGLVLFILKKLEIKGIIIFFAFIFVSNSYSLFFNNKSLKYFPDFVLQEKLNNQKVKGEIKLVFVMDQMAGIKSDASKSIHGKKFDKIAYNFAKKYNADLYENIYTQCAMTFQSIPKLINFDSNDNCENLEDFDYIKKSESFFSEYLITQNLLFEKFDSISVFQNYHMNFCENKNVRKCNQYTQFKDYNYVEGFKNTALSKIAGGWKHYGSIVGNIVWRSLLQINATDSFEQSGGEKGSFVSLLDEVKKDIISSKYDLIFIHSLATHNPYGFNEKCQFSGKKYINYSSKNYSEALDGQNYDRICIINFFDKFFEELKNKNLLKNIEFVILSDHGTRLSSDKDSTYKTIFIHKKKKNLYPKLVKEDLIIQKKFKDIFE